MSDYEDAMFLERCKWFAIQRLNNRRSLLAVRLNVGMAEKFDVRITWRDILKGLLNQ